MVYWLARCQNMQWGEAEERAVDEAWAAVREENAMSEEDARRVEEARVQAAKGRTFEIQYQPVPREERTTFVLQSASESPDEPQRTILPEEQLHNVARIVLDLTSPTRRNNGAGREDSYAASKAEIAQAARQLAEMVEAYLAGELQPRQDGDLPF